MMGTPRNVTILLVEDDPNMGFLLEECLRSSGFEVLLRTDGNAGLEAFRTARVDFCLFDVMLPGIDGFTLARMVREINPLVPVVFLTARALKPDKLKGFDAGGDDYITKPFDEEELVCRINAILGRVSGRTGQYNPVVPPREFYVVGKFRFEPANLSLSSGSYSERLTQREGEILRMLCVGKNNIVRRSALLSNLWGKDDYFNGRSLDVFITRLRKRLAGDNTIRLESIPKIGYMLHDKQAT